MTIADQTDIYVLGKFIEASHGGGASALSSRGPSPLAETTTAAPSSQAPSSLQAETVAPSALSSPHRAPLGDFYRYVTRGPRAGQWEALSLDTEVMLRRIDRC